MGAMMLVQVWPRFQWSPARRTVLEDLIAKVELSDELCAEYLPEEAAEWSEEAVRTYLRAAILDDLRWLEDVDSQEDVTTIWANRRWYYVTGGLSHGDQPTESARVLNRLWYVDGLQQACEDFADADAWPDDAKPDILIHVQEGANGVVRLVRLVHAIPGVLLELRDLSFDAPGGRVMYRSYAGCGEYPAGRGLVEQEDG